MYTVGLTGGIGSGKSTVEKLFQVLGVTVSDADRIAHQLVEPGQPALQQISNHFGTSILLPNGELDRDTVRQIVFQDAVAKQQLEAILHPLIYEKIADELSNGESIYGIASVPLLIETGHQNRMDRVLVVDCDPTIQIERIKQRDQLSDEEIERIMASQCTRKERLAYATDIIVNDGDLTSLKKQVDALHVLFTSLAKDID